MTREEMIGAVEEEMERLKEIRELLCGPKDRQPLAARAELMLPRSIAAGLAFPSQLRKSRWNDR